jgi:uncharacterized protein
MSTLASRSRAWVDLALLAVTVALLTVVDHAFVPVGVQGLVGVSGAFLVCWAVLTWRRQMWRDVGLSRPRRLRWLPLQVLAVLAAVLVVAMLVQPLLVAAFGAPDYSRFRSLIGDPERLVISLFVVWVTAAFFEEMVFRGFLLDRLTLLLGPGRGRAAVACVIGAALFGLMHAYQGPFGILMTATIGLVFSIAYFALGRRLWALIIAHGLINSWTMWQFYSLGARAAA